MSNETANASNSNASRYLSFSLGSEEYAMPLLQVREVIAMPEITPIPQTPNYFLGIMNLRGQVITVMDLRTKLNIKSKDGTEMAVIICDLSPLCIGVVVDSINSVVNPKEDEISARPEVRNSKAGDYISGVYKKEQGLVLMLELSKVLSLEDQVSLAKSAKKAA